MIPTHFFLKGLACNGLEALVPESASELSTAHFNQITPSTLNTVRECLENV